MGKDKEYNFLPDTQYEGRGQAYLDIDRMINEGMSGGSVHMRADSVNIGEIHELGDEDPPNIND
ncbi:hypothetical protein J2S13_001134 [Oikeobacillus pervagus]|uniref:Uncharacterized protein n=1 Tax=Oikeobacillus pervagus TaxID=1325931 RepID=A0AAJ1SZW0_9BACI|nr:hypothetical protein [Oikeobacillus pervagus]MDQ0214737.1 hypothetical protein [Oikeobacillus pervagus]